MTSQTQCWLVHSTKLCYVNNQKKYMLVLPLAIMKSLLTFEYNFIWRLCYLPRRLCCLAGQSVLQLPRSYPPTDTYVLIWRWGEYRGHPWIYCLDYEIAQEMKQCVYLDAALVEALDGYWSAPPVADKINCSWPSFRRIYRVNVKAYDYIFNKMAEKYSCFYGSTTCSGG